MTDECISPLRRRMIEDMTVRNFVPKTQTDYIRRVRAAPGLKYKAALSVAYGAGLRVSEVVALKVSDIDSARMMIRIEQSKRRKDRYAMLSPRLLDLLRDWWLVCRSRGWLFPGRDQLQDTDDSDGNETPTLSHPCPCCGGRMIIIEIFERGATPGHRPTAPISVIKIRYFMSQPKPQARKCAHLLRWLSAGRGPLKPDPSRRSYGVGDVPAISSRRSISLSDPRCSA